ncbi:MAG TPA: glycosyltransferase family 4 protein [Gemmataceae bacterium]|nr:glycosyltransferase family 4 protein [Gemmataceae bacterium]
MRLKIAIVVHGRFHAFDLARELLRLDHDVVLFTNYPASVARRFGIPPERVRSFLAHGVGSRLLWRLFPGGLNGKTEQLTNIHFGRWSARQVRQQRWDVVIAWSGVAEEVFQALGSQRTFKILQRGSAHIRVQQQLLLEEERRAGCRLEKPSDWIIAREEREYTLADSIHVLSQFAADSFTAQGMDPGKLFLLPLGVSQQVFRARPEAVQARRQRVLAGAPLRVLNVGTFSYRKGVADIAEVVRDATASRFRFRFVGPVAKEAKSLYRQLEPHVDFVPKQPQDKLARDYEWGDVFLLATIEDGFGIVLCQALAAGLPLLATTNCAGPDLIAEGKSGWVIPIRNPNALLERLLWLDAHREELAAAIQFVHSRATVLDWSDTARLAEQSMKEALSSLHHRVGFEVSGTPAPHRSQ